MGSLFYRKAGQHILFVLNKTDHSKMFTAVAADPALDPTEGHREKAFAPMHGDLRSGCWRGRETRAERWRGRETRAERVWGQFFYRNAVTRSVSEATRYGDFLAHAAGYKSLRVTFQSGAVQLQQNTRIESVAGA